MRVEEMATPTNSTKIRLKLLVDTSSNKVLFAETNKDFVDFLFGLLELPLGSLLALLDHKSMADESWSLFNIYQSVQNLDPNFYLQPNEAKSILLGAKKPPSNTKHTPLLKQLAYTEKEYSSGTSTRSCFAPQPPLAFSSYSSTVEALEGYVKDVVSYMVMDDLKVKPMSTISSITLLNTFQVINIACLREKTVEVDMPKGLELLKASFESTTVLTDVFFGKNVATHK